MKILLVLAMFFVFYLVIGIITSVLITKSLIAALNEINTKYDLKVDVSNLNRITVKDIIKYNITDLRTIVIWPIGVYTLVKDYIKFLFEELFEGIAKRKV